MVSGHTAQQPRVAKQAFTNPTGRFAIVKLLGASIISGRTYAVIVDAGVVVDSSGDATPGFVWSIPTALLYDGADLTGEPDSPATVTLFLSLTWPGSTVIT